MKKQQTKNNKLINLITNLGNIYGLFVVIRFILVFIPQTGYIHPDEFFQSVEVMTGEVFSLEHTRTWEFNQTFPVRSIVIPYFAIKLPLSFLKIISVYFKYLLHWNIRTPYILLVFPRLIMCLISFVNDLSLYQICKSYNQPKELRMVTLGSSFVMLIYGTRTFSNTIEMALLSALLYVVAECMVHTNTVIFQSEYIMDKYNEAESIGEKVKWHKMKSALPRHSLSKCFWIGTLCVVGIFNRPTFLIYGMPIVFFWLIRGMGTKSVNFLDFNIRCLVLILSALPSLILFITMDSFYYGYLTASDIEYGELGINNFVVTPLNFIRYNIDPSKTGQHGIHPKYLHMVVNIPLLYNVLGVQAIITFAVMIYSFIRANYRHLPRAQSIVSLMNCTIFIPIIILSMINHQEPRFIIPIILPIVFLYAPRLKHGLFLSYLSKRKDGSSQMYGIKCWYLINIVLTVVFGFIHQGGIFPMANNISELLQLRQHSGVNIHLVTSHIYNVPLTFFNMPSAKILFTDPKTGQKYHRNKRFYLYEYGSLQLEDLCEKLKLILDFNEMNAVESLEKYELYLALPSSLSSDFNVNIVQTNNTVMVHRLVKTFYPHLSTEAMPSFLFTDLEFNHDFGTSQYKHLFYSFIKQFGLILYRIEIRK